MDLCLGTKALRSISEVYELNKIEGLVAAQSSEDRDRKGVRGKRTKTRNGVGSIVCEKREQSVLLLYAATESSTRCELCEWSIYHKASFVIGNGRTDIEQQQKSHCRWEEGAVLLCEIRVKKPLTLAPVWATQRNLRRDAKRDNLGGKTCSGPHMHCIALPFLFLYIA